MSKKPGFMLIELGIVMAILIIGILITVPSLVFIHHQLVRAELEQLYTRILYLQARAITSNQELSLTFDGPTNSYTFAEQKLSLANQVEFGTTPAALGPPSHPTSPLVTAITFPKNTLTFYPDGTMQAGALYLTDRHHTCLYALTVPIGNNPCVRKYSFHETWKLLP
jgi:type II secretory pathway pseudopilin PulG